jgi:amino acid adenylation domain-containing protein
VILSHVSSPSLAHWFLRGYSLNTDGVALRVGSRELTYQALHERARQLAAGILNVAGASAPRVGVLAKQSVEAYTGVLAAALCNGTVVPLNPDFPAARLEEMARAAMVSVLVTDEHGLAARETGPAVLRSLPVAAMADAPNTHEHRAAPDGIAYILFTSGSTGKPKGVPISNSQVDHYLRVVHDRYGFTTADVFSQNFDLTFDLAMFDMFAAWGSGGTLVAIPSTAMASLPRYLKRHGITVWFSAPSAIALARRWTGLAPRSFPTLRWSLFCGEPLLGTDAADWHAAAPGSIVENLYGPTELTISCSVHRWNSETSPAKCVNGIVSIGTLHQGLRSVLVDENGDLTESTGELCVSGPQTTSGYLDPRDDEHRFFEHAGDRWYCTGDVVRFDADGELVYLGRRDNQVQVRGCRVELAEVDNAVATCRDIEQAVTVQAHGELVTFYTGTLRDETSLIVELAKLLPRNVIPHELRHIEIFPLNANGKIDRNVLHVMAAGHAEVTMAVPGPESLRLLER